MQDKSCLSKAIICMALSKAKTECAGLWNLALLFACVCCIFCLQLVVQIGFDTCVSVLHTFVSCPIFCQTATHSKECSSTSWPRHMQACCLQQHKIQYNPYCPACCHSFMSTCTSMVRRHSWRGESGWICWVWVTQALLK